MNNYKKNSERSFAQSKLGTELIRKCIHILIALVPSLAALNRSVTAILLMMGVIVFTCAESLRFLGFSPPFVSPVTAALMRKREEGRFVLGPVTLGLGALLALLLFPPKAAALAIYSVAFGDSAASFAGRLFGRIRPAFLFGKSVEGSLACLAVSALAGFLVFGDLKIAFAAGIASAIIDALPLEDFDNLLLPLAVGLGVLIVQ